MAASNAETAAGRNRTTVERRSEREIVVTRTFDGPAHVVFKAWTTPELLLRWWAPRSMGMKLLSCETDVRVGGRYRFEFAGEGAQRIAFFGKYVEVVPPSRLAWTNEESADGSVTTVTFEERDGRTHLVLHDLYPSKEAFEAAGGSEGGLPEQFDQLDELLVELASRS